MYRFDKFPTDESELSLSIFLLLLGFNKTNTNEARYINYYIYCYIFNSIKMFVNQYET